MSNSNIYFCWNHSSPNHQCHSIAHSIDDDDDHDHDDVDDDYDDDDDDDDERRICSNFF